MAAARAFQQAVIAMSLRTVGFDRAFRNIKKGSKDSEHALGKMAGGLATATEGARTFTRDAVEGALEMSTRLRRMNVVMGGTAEGIEGLRKEQARVRVETGMTAEETDRLRMGLIEIGETSVETALKAAKVSQALQLDPDTTVGWFGLGKQMKMTATDTESMLKETSGLLLAMKVPPTAFFEQPAELAEIMRTRMLALGKQSPEAAKRFVKGAAAMTAVMSKAGIGTREATASMMKFASGSADAIFDVRKMTAGLSETEIPELLKSAGILQQDFTKAMDQAADAPDVLIAQMARLTDAARKEGPEAFARWRMWVDNTVGDKALANVIVNNTNDVIKAQQMASGSSANLTTQFDELLAAALKSPEALRKMRDEQMKVLKESVALNEVFPITNHLVELQTKALHFLATENEGVTGAMMGMGRGFFVAGGLVGEVAEKVSDFTIKATNTAKAINDIRKAAPHVGAAIAKALPTFTKWGQAITGIFKAAPLAVDAIDGISVVAGTNGGAFLKLAGTITGTAIPSFSAAIIALGPLLLIIGALAALTYLAVKAFEKYADSQEKAGQASVKFAKTQDIVMKTLVKTDKVEAKVFATEQNKLRIQADKARKGGYTMEAEAVEAKMRRRADEERGRLVKAGQLQPESTTPAPSSPTPVTPSSAFPPGAQMTRVAIQSLEEQRSQVGLLEQLVALMGGLPGAMTPPTAGGGAGGGGVNVTIRPDSGKMQLHKMLEVEARNQLGRAGYTQLGGLTHTA